MGLRETTTRAFALLLSGDAALWQFVWASIKTALSGLMLATRRPCCSAI